MRGQQADLFFDALVLARTQLRDDFVLRGDLRFQILERLGNQRERAGQQGRLVLGDFGGSRRGDFRSHRFERFGAEHGIKRRRGDRGGSCDHRSFRRDGSFLRHFLDNRLDRFSLGLGLNLDYFVRLSFGADFFEAHARVG